MVDDSEAKHFWAAVDSSGGPEACWLWQKSLFTQTGYGQVWFRKYTTTAHRVAWILTYSDPGSLKVLHRCPGGPVRACCNPAHLAIGTDYDNAMDRIKDGRQPRGEQVGSSKLKEWQVREIRRLHAIGTPMGQLVKEFGIHSGTIQPLLDGKTWKHVT